MQTKTPLPQLEDYCYSLEDVYQARNEGELDIKLIIVKELLDKRRTLLE